MNKGSSNEDLIVSLPCSGLCLHSPLPSTEQGVVGESGVQNSTYAPPPAPNLVHLNSDLILPDGSHPVPWVLALSEMHPELTAASRPFLQLDSFTKTVFLSLHLLKENFIHHPTLRFPRTIPVLSNEYFSTSCFLRHSLVLLLRM